MSPDRIVYSFIFGWVVLIAVLILLDWLGNPDRGGFRPKGERPPRNLRTRHRQRRRKRAEADAAVRTTLRDAYGASSLRLTWTRASEDAARQADDSLVVGRDGAVDVGSAEIVREAHTMVVGDPLPNAEESPAGWRVGVDPLALTRAGRAPTPMTVRNRVWKNHAGAAWTDENRRRVKSGKPPRRTNPLTGKVETARVDIGTGTAAWPGEPTDPFAADR